MALKRDRSICIKCKLTEPMVKIAIVKGKPAGICHTCRNLRQRETLAKAGKRAEFYDTSRNLTKINYALLQSLTNGCYSLFHNASKKAEGYIVVKGLRVYLFLDGEGALYKYDLFGISTYLSNLNIVIETTPIALRTFAGDLVPLEDVGKDLKLLDINDRLLMFDLKLREYAIAKIKEEVKQAKREADRLKLKRKRSLNPDLEP